MLYLSKYHIVAADGKGTKDPSSASYVRQSLRQLLIHAKEIGVSTARRRKSEIGVRAFERKERVCLQNVDILEEVGLPLRFLLVMKMLCCL